ncbi:MAG: FtsH protease activity modulator HflK [Gammaproteobacteria bacterium]|nr:FtsH protease activity modulator HflK [Gammaproteobacteria bacterium]NNJ49167.1 FtsH protease activity modulator HflK [Gammaproteobacteria bacterium]
MAWNEPGGNGDKDPWGGNRGNRGNQGPPDLDEVFKNLQKKFGSLFGGKGGRSSGGGSGVAGGGFGIGVVIVILLLFWIATGFYKVEEAERGVVFRFGKHVETTQRGLHWHLPVPIERVEKVDVTKVHTIPLNSTMLTQDENIVDILGTVQYQIDDAEKYLFNVRAPELSLTQVTESALRESIGRSKMDYVITEGRGEIAIQVKGIIQGIVNNYETGLNIFKVNIQSAKPPEAVKDAFDDVTQAREDEERFKNEAEAYRNEVLPKARGAAARLREEAEAYKNEVIARAEGEAERFEQLLKEYNKAPEVTRERLYLEMMESVLSNSSKVMVDVEGGNNLLYLPLDKLMERHTTGKTQDQQDAADIMEGIQQRAASKNNQRNRIESLRTRGTR